MRHDVLQGDSLAVLRTLPSESVQCCVTSPPYFGLRSYLPESHEDKHLEQGLEGSPEEYVARMVDVFREVRRVLRHDGTCWLNLGDSWGKSKELLGMPWRTAFAMQSNGWRLRQDVIWHKKTPMPESVRDRCTKAHEYVFLLTKGDSYYYDADAIATVSDTGATANLRSVWTLATRPCREAHFATMPETLAETCLLAGTSEKGCCRDCGSPWRRLTERQKLFRQRPRDYVKRTGKKGTGNSCANSVAGVAVTTLGWEPTCKCGSDEVVPCTVLDPFAGSGTTLAVAASLGVSGIGIELHPDYCELARKRISENV